MIVPDDIRSMAAWVFGHCGSTGKGGMVTSGLKRTIDAMNDPSNKVFPDPPLRESFVFPSPMAVLLTYVQATTSNFYSLFIWRPIHGDDENFNAGNNEPGVGATIEHYLYSAIRGTTRGSPAYKELQRRIDWLVPRVNSMEYEPKSNWWDGPLHQDSSVSTS